jgi:hypothetical protein
MRDSETNNDGRQGDTPSSKLEPAVRQFSNRYFGKSVNETSIKGFLKVEYLTISSPLPVCSQHRTFRDAVGMSETGRLEKVFGCAG